MMHKMYVHYEYYAIPFRVLHVIYPDVGFRMQIPVILFSKQAITVCVQISAAAICVQSPTFLSMDLLFDGYLLFAVITVEARRERRRGIRAKEIII